MKRILMSFVLLVALALVTSGCFHNTVVTSPDYDPGQTIPDHEELRFHIAGIIPLSSTINLNSVCPQGAGVVETRYLFDLGVIGIPVDISQARVHCVPGSADLNDEQLEEQLAATD